MVGIRFNSGTDINWLYSFKSMTIKINFCINGRALRFLYKC